jgi:hypothetical protein
MNLPLAYWHSGGEVLAGGGSVLTPADVEALQGLYVDEARAARAAGEPPIQVERLAYQLTTASDAAARWRRASGPVWFSGETKRLARAP